VEAALQSSLLVLEQMWAPTEPRRGHWLCFASRRIAHMGGRQGKARLWNKKKRAK